MSRPAKVSVAGHSSPRVTVREVARKVTRGRRSPRKAPLTKLEHMLGVTYAEAQFAWAFGYDTGDQELMTFSEEIETALAGLLERVQRRREEGARAANVPLQLPPT